jgi:ethanolamine-phosphate cytidylyltransferase
VLTVLGCRYVDEVVMGAPFVVSDEYIRGLSISVVVHGKHDIDPVKVLDDAADPYRIPKQLGIYRELESIAEPTTSSIVARVLAQRETCASTAVGLSVSLY